MYRLTTFLFSFVLRVSVCVPLACWPRSIILFANAGHVGWMRRGHATLARFSFGRTVGIRRGHARAEQVRQVGPIGDTQPDGARLPVLVAHTGHQGHEQAVQFRSRKPSELRAAFSSSASIAAAPDPSPPAAFCLPVANAATVTAQRRDMIPRPRQTVEQLSFTKMCPSLAFWDR